MGGLRSLRICAGKKGLTVWVGRFLAEVSYAAAKRAAYSPTEFSEERPDARKGQHDLPASPRQTPEALGTVGSASLHPPYA